MARRVQQVEHRVLIFKGHHRRGDRDAAFLLDLHPVGFGAPRLAARLDPAGGMDRPAQQQQMLGQGGLARVGMGNDREGAPSGGFAGGGLAHGARGVAEACPLRQPASTSSVRSRRLRRCHHPLGAQDTSPARAPRTAAAVKTIESIGDQQRIQMPGRRFRLQPGAQAHAEQDQHHQHHHRRLAARHHQGAVFGMRPRSPWCGPSASPAPRRCAPASARPSQASDRRQAGAPGVGARTATGRQHQDRSPGESTAAPASAAAAASCLRIRKYSIGRMIRTGMT